MQMIYDYDVFYVAFYTTVLEAFRVPVEAKHSNVCFSVWQQILSIKYVVVNIKSSCQIVTYIQSI